MGAIVYMLCALTAAVCFGLLWRAWRENGAALLFWSGLCFAGLTAGNVLLVIDKLVLTDVDLAPLRLSVTLVSVLLLIFGLVWEEER